MLRPIEYSLNSPDNVLLGFSTKYLINSSYIYGQLVVDELVSMICVQIMVSGQIKLVIN